MKSAIVYYSMSGNCEMVAEKALDKLKKILDIDAFEAELILIDPKTNVKPENDKKIEEFCEGFGENHPSVTIS
ncbi:MAG: hypothetical protein K6E63_11650 [Lachnospiraceae bacterium]|nr:hypothetical protein [Lachnospiraceae bacterium]